jgi:hypothetical protein
VARPDLPVTGTLRSECCIIYAEPVICGWKHCRDGGESGEKRNHTDKKKILWAGKKHVLSIGGRDQIIRDSACEMRALERTSMKRGAACGGAVAKFGNSAIYGCDTTDIHAIYCVYTPFCNSLIHKLRWASGKTEMIKGLLKRRSRTSLFFLKQNLQNED